MKQDYIPKLYKRQAIDLLVFAYTKGVRKALPSVSVRESIMLFMVEFNVDESEFPLERLRKEYYRLQEEYENV
jgi:hypothetical protein